MFEEFPRSSGRRPSLPSNTAASTPSETEDVTEDALSPGPIVLHTFGRRSSEPTYRWSLVFSVVLHVTLIGLTLWLNRKVILPRAVGVAVLFQRLPPSR